MTAVIVIATIVVNLGIALVEVACCQKAAAMEVSCLRTMLLRKPSRAGGGAKEDRSQTSDVRGRLSAIGSRTAVLDEDSACLWSRP